MSRDTRKAWQPSGPLSKDFIDKFMEQVEVRDWDGHWRWTGKTQQALHGGRWIIVSRLAFAIRYPGVQMPNQLYRHCKQGWCINPEHMVVRGSEFTAPAAEDEITIPRTIEAMANIQFGTPVTKRTLRRLVVSEPVINGDHSEGCTQIAPNSAGRTQEEPDVDQQLVDRPQPRNGRAGDRAVSQDVTLEEALGALFQPDVVIMTFRTGHIWIRGGGGRIEADDPATALKRWMIQMGLRKVQG